MRVLLLDDSPSHRRAGERQLTAVGCDVVALCDYEEAVERAKNDSFDVALVDLLMPAEPTTLGPRAQAEFVGRDIAVGFPLALQLSRWIGYVAVATDTNHHAHPMSAIVDWFHGTILAVNGATVMIMHAPMTEDGTKDWGQVLTLLTARRSS